MKRLIIGTRGSRLALWQAGHVAELLQARHEGLVLETAVIQSEGDLDLETPLTDSSGVGIFVRRLERALQDGEVDLAVHSLKDMPTQQPDGLLVAAVPQRHDARDALLSEKGWTLSELPPGTIVGTGSPRRRGQLLHARPDLEIVGVRGNLDTRLRKLAEGQYGALALAMAGVERLGIDSVAVRPLTLEESLPACGQGALAVEVRTEDEATRAVVEALSHPPTLACVEAERAFLRRIEAGCQAPATAYARHVGGKLRLDALVADANGLAVLMERETADPAEGPLVAARLAERLLVAGAEEILQRGRRETAVDDASS